MIIYNAEIYTMEGQDPIRDGYVVFDRKKILEIGSGDGREGNPSQDSAR